MSSAVAHTRLLACRFLTCLPPMLLQRSTPLAKTSGLDLSFLTTFAGERAGLDSSAPATTCRWPDWLLLAQLPRRSAAGCLQPGQQR